MRAYNITAPEEIAKEYGGNKRKIQQAASQGIISPTEAVMAGMFIDRMRNAAVQEQAQQPTVAEQVMNPQPPMLPQARMGQPSPQAMMAAKGGMLTIPYDEGDYAEGGIVSFSVAGNTYAQAKAQLQRQLAASRIKSEQDEIKGQLAQLEAQYQKSTYQPSLAEADLSTATANVDVGDPESAMALGPEYTSNQGQRIDPNRFNTGTYTGAETKYMGKGSEVLDNVERGFGMFTDFVRSKLPSFGEVEKLTDPDTDMLGSSAESLPVEPDRINPSGGNRFNTGTFTEQEARRIAKERGGVDQLVSPTVQTAPMRSTDLTLPAQQNIISNMTSDQVIANEAARGKTGRGLMDPTLLYRAKAYGDARRGDPFVGGETVVPAQDPSLPSAMTMSGVDTVAEQVKQTEKEANAVTNNQQTTDTPRLTTEQAAASENVNVQELENAGVGAETLTTIGSLADMFNREEGAAAKKYRKYLQDLPKQAGQRKADALAMFALQTGIGMLAQPGGQTVFQAAGKSADKAIKTYAAEMKDIRGLEEKALKGEVALEELQQKRADANLKIAADIYGRQLVADTSLAAAKINAGKPTDATRGINRFATAIREKVTSGEMQPMSDAQIMLKAQNDYYGLLAEVQAAKVAQSGVKDQAYIMNLMQTTARGLADSQFEAFKASQEGMTTVDGDVLQNKYAELYNAALTKQLKGPLGQFVSPSSSRATGIPLVDKYLN